MLQDYDAFVDKHAIFGQVVALALVLNSSLIRAVAVYPFLALGGEVGELLNNVKKIHRDSRGIIADNPRLDLALELGDILWYLTACAHELNYTLDDIVKLNVLKLENRTVIG